MSESPVLYEETDGVAIITLNGAPKNLFNDEVVRLLREAFSRLNEGEARAGVICANGDNFTMGADIRSFPKDIGSCIPGVGIASDKPLVGAVSGWCIGAAVTLIQMCDLCVASESARFAYTEARLGISMGMIAELVARIPHKVAMEIMLTGGTLSAQRAYEVGFVNKVVPVGAQRDAALEYAKVIAANAPLVVARLRRLVGTVMPQNPAIDAYLMQRELTHMLQSDDLKEGMSSFVEKRQARFVGR
ncbi:hypothetical protein BJN34_33025 [Cupriavidus necator]|uniref:Enoyl-CoA hydratase n=1 Tax=Cupriavidus necator TaxID=106590 RepID=A0A1U9V1D3_CUPNE|nr:enoyl-CoA hydratase-related protein [Cupriavidus necator]AQV98703.1 hypothetical protein BJN34_33025 [Cupriavidus necator]